MKILRYIFHIDHAIISLLTISIIGILVFMSFNISFLSPVKRAIGSFSMTSIYYQIMDDEELKDTSDIITLVDMTELSHRDSIAMVIEQISSMQPRKLAVDIIFEGYKDDVNADQRLTDAFFDCADKTVVAYKLLDYNGKGFTNAVRSFFVEDVPVTQGFTNAMTDDARVVRCYNISYDYKGKKCYSLPAQIAMSEGINLSDKPVEHIINYSPIHFPVVSWKDLKYHPELIKDRIVLFGTTKQESDMHYTPLKKMSGLEVIAYAVTSMFEGYDVKKAPLWVALLLAFIVGYITNAIDFLFRLHSQRRENFLMVFIRESNLYLRIIYFLLMVVVTWITFLLYIKAHYYINSILALSTIILIGEGRLIYKGLLAAIARKHPWPLLTKSLYAPENLQKTNKTKEEVVAPADALPEVQAIETNINLSN